MTRLLTAAAFAALIAGPAAAQTMTTTTQSTTSPDTPAANMTTGQSTTSRSMTAPGQTGLTGGLTNNASAMGTTMSMNAEVQVTAMAPIPDTPENRARYGQPESRSGRMKLGEGPVRSLPNAGRAMAQSRTSAQAE
jgi:hypothetical protein